MIFIAIPAFDHKIHWTCTTGIAQTAHYCAKENIGFCCDVIPGDAFIGKARNLLVHRFLETDARDLIFIDADVGFNVDGIIKLCTAEPPIVLGLYQMKKPPPDRYPALLYDPLIRYQADQSLIKLQYGPTGFMRIRREVFEALAKEYPDDWYEGDVRNKDDESETDKIFDFFPHGTVDNKFVGEDINFCNRVKSIGFDIWAAQNIELTHSGENAWKSNWAIDVLKMEDAA